MRQLAIVAGIISLSIAFGIGAFVGALYFSPNSNRTYLERERVNTTQYSYSYSGELKAPQSPAERQNRDLYAQEAMAKWASAAFVVAIVGTTITALGTIFLLKQIQLTRSSIRLSEWQSITQMRAWISLEKCSILTEKSNGYVTHFIIVFTWKNTGSTPALNLRGIIGEIKTEDQKNGKSEFPNSTLEPSVVGPNLSFNTNFYITPSKLLKTKSKPILIRSAIQYDAAFASLKNRENTSSFYITLRGNEDLKQLENSQLDLHNISILPAGFHDTMT